MVEPASAAEEIRLLAAMKVYEHGWLSSETAATLAGLAPRGAPREAQAYGISSFQLSPADLDQDLENAPRATRKGCSGRNLQMAIVIADALKHSAVHVDLIVHHPPR